MKYTKRFSSLSESLVITIVAVVFAFSSVLVPRIVEAQTSLEDQVRALEAENDANRDAVADLMQVATSYKDAIEKLEAQISQLQAEINKNEAQKAELERQINELQIKLEKEKAVLGENIKAMYVNGEMSTIEMLATSKDLSEFVDKEAYRNAVQQKIQVTMEEIARLQNELGAKKQAIEELLQSLQKQRASVSSARAEQARLLSMNQQEQASFNNRTESNQAKIDDLNRKIAAQRAANNSGIVPDGGYYFIRFPGQVKSFNPDNYPYKNAGFSMQEGPCSHYDYWPDAPDAWGYCTRQCVSYTAWAVGASGRSIPYYYGNAKNWIYKAPSSYIHRTPQVGDIAITTGGTWGHAMYVEEVNGSQIFVSQYNQQLDGRFSYQWRTWR